MIWGELTMPVLTNKRIGFGVTGSFCTLHRILPVMKTLTEMGAQVIPIFSPIVYESDTRYFSCGEFIDAVREITGRMPIHTIVEAEPIGPRKLLDAMVIAPCTGNSMAKLAAGITDTAVLMAAKAQLRNGGPVVVAPSTNDGLSNNGANLGKLLNTRGIFLVPYGQDSAASKPASLVAHMELIPQALEKALEGIQMQPLLQPYRAGDDV